MTFLKFKTALRNYEENEKATKEPMKEMSNAVMKMNFKDNNGQSGNTNKDNSVRCFACGEIGHRSFECDSRRDRKWCNFCKSTTHYGKDCRNKQTDNRTDTAKKVCEQTNIEYTFCFLTSDSENMTKEDSILVDCGATDHVINDEKYFINFDEKYLPENHFIELADGSRTNNMVKKRGTAVIRMKDENGIDRKAELKNALFVPSYPQKIFSVQAATDSGAEIHFNSNSAELVKEGVKFPIIKDGGLYYLYECAMYNNTEDKPRSCDLETWHKLLGHCNKFNEEINMLRKENEKLLQNLENYKSEMNILRDEKKGNEQKLHEARRENDSSSKYVNQIANDLKDSLEQNSNLKSHLESLENEVQHIEQAYYVALQENKGLQEKCTFYKEETDKQNAEHEAKFAEMRNQEKRQKQIIATISAEQTILKEKLKEVTESSQENENKYKEAIENMKAMSAKNHELQTGMIKKYKTLSQKALEMNTSQDEELKHVKEKNASLSFEAEKHDLTRRELSRLRQKHEKVLRTLEELTNQVSEYQMKNEKMQATLNEMEEMETSLNESIDGLSMTNKDTYIQMRKLEEVGQNKQDSYEETIIQLNSIDPAEPVISWKSRRQPTIALSSCEAELMTLAMAIQEAILLRMLIKELGINDDEPVNLYRDNRGSIVLVKNPSNHARLKHIDIKYHFIRDAYSKRIVEITYVCSAACR